MASAPEANDTRGLTQRELLLEVRADLKEHIVVEGGRIAELERTMETIPTRAELLRTTLGVFTIAGIVSGIFFGLMHLLT